MKPVNLIVVGLGHQSQEDHLPAISELENINLVGVCDVDLSVAEKIGQQYDVPYSSNIDELLDKNKIHPDAALVALPHHEYLSMITKIASKGINIIKEKPYAISSEEAIKLYEVINKYNVSLQVTLQRRFNPVFTSFNQLKRRIGSIYSIEARYTLNIARLDYGWRANKSSAGGGALIDMGYHYIDLINWYFGIPDEVSCKLTFGNRENQIYDVEDTAFMNFSYCNDSTSGKNVLGSLIVSRVYPEKDEVLVAYGSRGSVRIHRGELCRRNLDGEIVELLERRPGWPSAIIDQLDEYATNIMHGKYKGTIEKKNFAHTAIIEAAYLSAQNNVAESPKVIYDEILRRTIHKNKQLGESNLEAS